MTLYLIDVAVALVFAAIFITLGYRFGHADTHRLNNAPVKTTLVVRPFGEKARYFLATRMTQDDWLMVPEVGEGFVLSHECLAALLENQDWRLGHKTRWA